MSPTSLSHLFRRVRAAAGAAAFVPWMLGGLLSLEAPLAERWPWAGAWRMPVGDARRLGVAGDDGAPAFALLRGVHAADSTRRAHSGADLGNRRGGDRVVAAAHGVVIHVEPRPVPGYGCHVVIAHRDPIGRLAYSVYSHLEQGSIEMTAGTVVWSGQPLGRVGRTGRASTPHLHFEVRIPDRPGARWEHARVVPPHVYVTNRLAVNADDPLLAWAETAGLIPRERHAPEAPLERAAWHAALAAAARHTEGRVTQDSGPRTRMLAEIAVIEARGAGEVPWSEVEADLGRLDGRGHRLPPPPLGMTVTLPSAAPRGLRPTLSQALAALAALATDPPVAVSPDPSGR